MMIVDGHMKGIRLVCDYLEGEIECEELGSVQVGCKKTPIKGSNYCVDHQFYTISTEQSFLVTNTENENQLQCKTEKRKQAANKHRSAGICCALYNCGIIVGITELF